MANYKRIVGEHVVTPPSTDSWVLKISIFFYLNTPINLDRYTKYGLKMFTLRNKKKNLMMMSAIPGSQETAL